ncbi:MAG: nicotinamide-nucleotide adenylyltransferase [Candidatus Gracilibacteria bacterium]|jgi:nicotinamide-nucleotide adenylyltransferase
MPGENLTLQLDALIDESIPPEVLSRIDRKLLLEQLAKKIASTMANARNRVIALYPGRFQPFHNGHLHVLRRALTENDEVVIGIGSPYKSFTSHDPFTASERMQMIRATLEEEGVSRDKYQIVTIPDIDRPELWVQHVACVTPPFGRVYAPSEYTAHLFEITGDYEVCRTTLLEDGEGRISASRVRQLMTDGGDWKGLVPNPVAEEIKRFGGEARLAAVSRD